MAGTIVFMPHTFYALRNSEKEEENAEDGEYSEDEEKVEDIEDAERDYPAPIEYNFNCENAVKIFQSFQIRADRCRRGQPLQRSRTLDFKIF